MTTTTAPAVSQPPCARANLYLQPGDLDSTSLTFYERLDLVASLLGMQVPATVLEIIAGGLALFLTSSMSHTTTLQPVATVNVAVPQPFADADMVNA